MFLSKPAARLLAALAFGGTAVPSIAEPPELITGVSFYNLSLERAEDGSAISALDGRMVDAITQTACGVFKNETRMQMDIGTATGQNLSQVATSVYVEEPDGLSFEAALDMNGATLERAKGKAVRTAGGSTTVTLELPAPKTVTFDEEVTFPMEMVRRAVDAALAGGTSVELHLYDGLGGGETLRLVSVLIGPSSTGAITGDEAALVERLGYQGKRHWPITFTAYPPGVSDDAVPEYSITSTVFEDGFSVNSTYDFNIFAMRLHLVDFQPGDSPACEAPQRSP